VTGLAILGATGSIGASTLQVATQLAGRFAVVALASRSDWRKLAALASRWHPEAVALSDEGAWREARAARAFDQGVVLLGGEEGVLAVAQWASADTVVNGLVGAAGLPSTLASLVAGKRVALANKESLVVGGELVARLAGGALGLAPDGTFAPADARLVPIDSEHSALWQLLERRPRATVRRVILTASGGPFRGAGREHLARVTPEEALAHPTWSMGAKITVDSATLANKGLEVIEAHWLFGLPYEAIDVVVHPQSIVHGLVETVDDALYAQLGIPDMRHPIRVALTWPDRVQVEGMIDMTRLSGLEFLQPDLESFPMLRLGLEAGRMGGTTPAVYNAANEVLVAAFLERSIGFLEIAKITEQVLEEHDPSPADSLEILWNADDAARRRTSELAGLTSRLEGKASN
jgi:1-deoxy-D-xylulose-5-phosphate reductoisomerase